MSFDSIITFLPTRDLKQTARFYEDVLKLELALTIDSAAGKAVLVIFVLLYLVSR